MDETNAVGVVVAVEYTTGVGIDIDVGAMFEAGRCSKSCTICGNVTNL